MHTGTFYVSVCFIYTYLHTYFMYSIGMAIALYIGNREKEKKRKKHHLRRKYHGKNREILQGRNPRKRNFCG